ncbi:MAG: TVP38/TMEM64 family protein [Alphaproteobacteria bacterium]
MPKLPHFLTHMDKEARRAIFVVVAMFALVLLVLTLGKSVFAGDEGVYQRWFEAVSGSPWAVLIVVATFVGAAFIGVPQWALIAGTIVAFGPVYGSLYAWAATMVSATLNFWLGRWVGADRVKKFGGELVNRIISVVRRNGFVTSLAVRFVPTGPFVIVNMAAGVSGMKFPMFFAGTALGTIPKILVVGLLAQGVLSGAQGDRLMFAFVILALLFIAIMLIARRRLKRHVDISSGTAKKSNE